MSGSGAGEMAPTSSKVVVFPKFDMHVYTSELTSSELKAAVADYLIPMDLHPRLPPPGMTMDRLLSRYIRLYMEQLEQGGLRLPFSSFFLAVIKHFEGHWFSFENKTGRGTRKCFKEVTTSLKCWKRNFFLINRRAIPDAMPWRHDDTDLHDDFPSNFNQDDVERLFEFLVPLRPPPCHLLYVCGLTTACRHPGLSYCIKDQDKNVISMDTFLKLPNLIGTIVSKGDPIPEDQRPKPRVTPPLPEEEKQSLARAEAKHAGAGQAGGSMKKRKVQKHNEPTQSGSEETLSASPIRQAHPEASKKPTTVIPPKVPQGGPHVKKEFVDLSGNMCVSTPPATANQPSPPLDHHDADENPDPNINHFATLVKDEFLGILSNTEVLNRAYQTLRQSVVAQGELLKRHEQLNHDYVDLRNRRDTDLAELERLRSGLRKAIQDKDEITKKFTLLDNAHSECTIHQSRESCVVGLFAVIDDEFEEWAWSCELTSFWPAAATVGIPASLYW
nr:hypothetical protein [Tanacetum cinerariifolium]